MSKKTPLNTILTISLKELTDYVRDWRTLLAVVIVPLLMFPAIFFVLPLVMQSELDERQSMQLDVLIESNTNESEIGYLISHLSEHLLNYTFTDLDTNIKLNDTTLVMEDIKNSNIDSILRISIFNELLNIFYTK